LRVLLLAGLVAAVGFEAAVVSPGVACAAESGAFGAPTDDDEAAAVRRRARSAFADDEEGVAGGGFAGMGSMLSGRSGLFGTALLAVGFYFLFMRGRRGAGDSSWGSYYLFWIVAPILIATVSSHPAILGVVVFGLFARRWLPDPFLALKYRGRVRALEVDVATNPGNVTARRDLATIWLQKRRASRALPLLEQALARDGQNPELLYLSGVAHHLAGRSQPAVDALVSVIHADPGFRYGEAYLRAADALMALRRWDDADEALDHFLKKNSSSVEALYKRAKVRKAKGDAAGAKQALAELRDTWRTLPSFQRRQQLGWYLRSRFA
jgi:tetratricopeptide (TPR) repeat protein